MKLIYTKYLPDSDTVSRIELIKSKSQNRLLTLHKTYNLFKPKWEKKHKSQRANYFQWKFCQEIKCSWRIPSMEWLMRVNGIGDARRKASSLTSTKNRPDRWAGRDRLGLNFSKWNLAQPKWLKARRAGPLGLRTSAKKRGRPTMTCRALALCGPYIRIP